MKNKLFKLYLLTFLVLVDFVAFAQPGDDDGSGGLEGNDPPPAPINGKLIWLAFAGIVFALYSIRKYRRLAKY
ncbi:hypothetical protein G4D82_08960 [Flavobacterium sp. CYK-4]|uniref:hypothetical protein n=1 Tax=Flavobacterium lotistagni TaxID=2709660 RepID=UPI00140C9B79|nr:hypothetical protein [Flavobacterium lotistagni]NHM07348.1 hypothetical protein [Flavobacterium lotistagni]